MKFDMHDKNIKIWNLTVRFSKFKKIIIIYIWKIYLDFSKLICKVIILHLKGLSSKVITLTKLINEISDSTEGTKQ